VHDAIAQAGGIGPTGDFKKVSVISQGSGHPVSLKLDLRPQATARGALDYQVQYEDIVIVGQKGGGLGAAVPIVAAVAAVITSVILVLDYFDNGGGGAGAGGGAP